MSLGIQLALLAWTAFGAFLYVILFHTERIHMTLPQLIFTRLIAGPALWVVSLWQLLGLWGKRE